MQLDQHRGLSGGLEDHEVVDRGLEDHEVLDGGLDEDHEVLDLDLEDHEVLDQAQPDLQDHELDAILGELRALATQFSKEITIEERKRLSYKE